MYTACIYVDTRVFMLSYSSTVIDTRLELFQNCSRVTCISTVERIKGISDTKDEQGRESSEKYCTKIQKKSSSQNW